MRYEIKNQRLIILTVVFYITTINIYSLTSHISHYECSKHGIAAKFPPGGGVRPDAGKGREGFIRLKSRRRNPSLPSPRRESHVPAAFYNLSNTQDLTSHISRLTSKR